MNIYMVTILLSLLAYVAVGNYVGRRVKHLEDYFVAGRQAPTLLIVGTLVASFLSTNTFMGQAGLIYAFNGGIVLIPSLLVTGYLYGALYFGRYLRRSNALTVAEYFANRFDSKRVQIIAGITVIVGISFYLIAVTQGVGLILSNLTTLSYLQAMIVAWVCYTSFTLYAGSRGVVITDTMMFVFFTIISVIAMFTIFDHHGGWVTAMKDLVHLESKPGLMSWHGVVGPGRRWETPAEFMIWYGIIMVAWSFVTAISPWQSSRYLMAKNEHVVMRSACVAAIFVTLIPAMVQAAGATINLSNDAIDPPDEVLVWAALNILSPLVGALLLAGLVAAALSSASTFLSLIGFNLSNDIIHRQYSKEGAKLKFSRIMMLVAGIAILAACLWIPQNILWLTYFAGTLYASAWGPVSLMSIWSDRITESAAFWGITTGFLGNAVPKLLETYGLIDLPVYLDPILLGAAISLIAVLMVSSRTTVTEKELSYRLALLKTPKEELNTIEAKKTLCYVWGIIAFAITMTVIMLVYWVLPYQKALAEEGQPFAFDWFTGETFMAFGWSLALIPMGYLLYRGVRKDYMSSQKSG